MMRVFLATLFFGISTAQIFIEKKCPKTQLTTNFQLEKYLGLWYEIRRFPAEFERDGKCIRVAYNKLPDGNIDVINQGINATTNRRIAAVGVGTLIPTPRKEARLYVKFPNSPFDKGPAPRGNYWILDTDYISYSLVYSCEQIGNMSVQFAWILTRKQIPDERLIRKAIYAFKSFGVPIEFFTTTEQTKCPRLGDDDVKNVQKRAASDVIPARDQSKLWCPRCRPIDPETEAVQK